MSVAKNVHVTGIDNVLEWYKQMEIPNYAIFDKNQFLFKCLTNSLDEGAEHLRWWADIMGENYGHFTFKVYEDVQVIKDKTACDGSFNFCLNENPNRGHNNELLSRITAIEKKLKGGDEEEEEEEQEDNTYGLGKLGLILQHPAIEPLTTLLLDKASDRIVEWFDGKPAKVAGVERQSVPTDEQSKIDNAIKRLQKTTPNLGDILIKLATISEEKPLKWKSYLFTLSKL